MKTLKEVHQSRPPCPALPLTIRPSTRVLVTGMFLAATTFVSAQLPAPLSFYDFEEADGVTVLDQGTAGNHGEIVDPFNDTMARVAGGGIYSQTGEGRRCLQWIEENAFGFLGYVNIPYHEVLNSPNYTLSTWMRYGSATPNWGYLFWAGGDVWPEPQDDRHLDVWLNPGVNGVDSILHTEDGSAFRVTTDATESGVAVMDGDWHLVTVTLANSRVYKIYLDGKLAAEGEAETDIAQNIGNDLWLGARPNDAIADKSVKIFGYLDRVRIWDVALSETQVAQLYAMEGPEGATATPTPAVFNAPVLVDGSVTISWTGQGTLQEADSVAGTWTDSANQTNPQSRPPVATKFFRLK